MSYEVFHRDLSELVDFYVRVLAFRPPEDNSDTEYAVVTRDDVRVGCCRHSEADPTPRLPPVGSEIVLRVDDVRAEHQRVIDSGWPLADAFQARPWGTADFRVLDPTGQYLRITSVLASS